MFTQSKCLVCSGIGLYPCPESVAAGEANIKASALSANVGASRGAAHALWVQTAPRKTRMAVHGSDFRCLHPAVATATPPTKRGTRGYPAMIFFLPLIPPEDLKASRCHNPVPVPWPHLWVERQHNTVWLRRVIRPRLVCYAEISRLVSRVAQRQTLRPRPPRLLPLCDGSVPTRCSGRALEGTEKSLREKTRGPLETTGYQPDVLRYITSYDSLGLHK